MADWLRRVTAWGGQGKAAAGPRAPSARRCVVIDCETTGLSPDQGDRMVSFAAIEILDHAPSGRAISLIFNPGRKSNPHALRVHRLADHVLRHQPAFAASADELKEFLGAAVIVGHNVSFDIAFLRHEFRHCGLAWEPAEQFCTMDEFRRQGAGRATLDAAASHFGIDASARAEFHGAFVDAEITSRLFQKMVLRNQAPQIVSHISPTNFIQPPPVVRIEGMGYAGGVAGKAIAITGELSGMSREEAAGRIEACGGTWHRTVRKDTDFLVVGCAPGSGKLDTAAARRAKYGKPDNIDEAHFLKLLAASVQTRTM